MDENGMKKAQIQEITVLESDGPVFETALAVYQAMKEE